MVSSDTINYFNQRDQAYLLKSQYSNVTDLLYTYLVYNHVKNLLEDPDLFTTRNEYNKFIDDHKVALGLMAFNNMSRYSNLNPNNIQQVLQQTNMVNVNNKLRTRIIHDPLISNNPQNMLKSQTVGQGIVKYQTKAQIDHLNNQSTHLKTKKLTNGEAKVFVKQLTNPKNKKIPNSLELLKKQKQKTTLFNKNLDMMADQKATYNAMNMRKEEDKPSFKQWIWHPNEHTRHSSMHMKQVDFEDYFLVESDRGKCNVAEMLYPKDPTGPVCQVANCLCTVVYKNNKNQYMKWS